MAALYGYIWKTFMAFEMAKYQIFVKKIEIQS